MKLKKIIMVFCVCCLVLSECNAACVAKAEANYSMVGLKEYMEYQGYKNTTKAPKEIEQKLNSQGVFDEEIEALSDQVIEDIEEGANYIVDCKYYKVAENELCDTENGDIEIQNNSSSVEELEKAEIESIIDGLYGEEVEKFVSEQSENEEWSILSAISGFFSGLSTKARAATNRVSTDLETSSDGYLKQLLVIVMI